MLKKFTLNKMDFVFFSLFLLSVPFSVTVSQAFAVLTILSYLVFSMPKFKDFPLLFWFLLALYLSILASRLFAKDVSISELIQILSHSEFSDFWMAFILLPASRFSNKQKSKIRGLLKYTAIFFLLTGIISLFFPYRLSTFVMDGFTYLDGRRLPHQIAFIEQFQIPLFLPIGFQNTHLTYGALLSLFAPSLFFQTFRFFSLKNHKHRKFRYLGIVYTFLSLLSFCLLLLNQSRSIVLGIAIAFILFIPTKRSLFNKKNLMKGLAIISILIAIAIILYQENWLFKRSIDQLFTKQTLENQRVWIHKANFNLISQHPLIGIGTGNYTSHFEKSYMPLLSDKPFLYYEISITPKSHAHHDFLHFYILGGIFSGFIFLLIWILITKQILNEKQKAGIYLGIFAVFIGGMFQCFMLDDETFLPLLAIFSLTRRGTSNDFVKPCLIVLIPLFISLLSLYQLANTEEETLFLHRTRDKNNFLLPEAQKTINGNYINIHQNSLNTYYFKLEGCLSHKANFQQLREIRILPLRITIEIPPVSLQAEYPSQYEIELRKRDAFDQDKLFKAHSESVIKVIRGPLIIGINKIEIQLPLKTEDQELKFYDLGVLYQYKSVSMRHFLPILRMQENCY